MARQELHSDMLPKPEQLASIIDPSAYDGDVVLVDNVGAKDYADELAFMQEPVTIRLEPSNAPNAAAVFPVWTNGKPAEVLINGRWSEMGYLPVGQVLTVRRHVLEIIVRAKIDAIHTRVSEMESERPKNAIDRFTSPVHSFSVIEDKNPRGPAWISEIRRRNF